MSTPFLAEMRIMSFNFAPRGWAECNGQLLPINQNQALFSLLGTTYGGDGRVNFALPDLRSRTPVHIGQGIVQGEKAGQEAHTITMSEMPSHTHVPQGNSAVPNTGAPAGAYWCDLGNNPYTNSNGNTTLNPASVTNTGGSQAHSNIQPYLTINICIALQGIFPSQN